MLVAPLVTVLVRRFGTHRIMLVGALLQCSGFVAASFATRIWQLHLSQGVLIGLGIGCLYIPSLPILSQWFVKKRSLANGISAAGSGVGGVAFAWGSQAMIQHISISWSLRITGIIAFVAILAAIAVIRDRNDVIRPPQLAFDTRLLRRLDVMMLLAWAFISMLGYVVLLFSLSDFALSKGFSRAQATDLIGFLNLGTAIGRPVIGVVSDRWSRIDTAGILTLACGLSCFGFWLPATSYGLTVFFAIICGAIVGVFWMVRALSVIVYNTYRLLADYRASLRRSRRHPRFAVFIIVIVGYHHNTNDCLRGYRSETAATRRIPRIYLHPDLRWAGLRCSQRLHAPASSDQE
jgi:MFS family permease